MKFLITLFIFISLFTFTKNVHAQLQSTSNIVTTDVGTPIITSAICPIPNGIITCGSKNMPIGGCGHCGVGYEAFMKNCTYPGINYAMDIGGADNAPVILPSVNGKTISWTFVDQTNEVRPPLLGASQAIQLYAGTNTETGEKYWIQFHHTNIGSGVPGTHLSGERGANICSGGCNMGHVHVEFAKVDTSGNNVWVDAPTYFCK